jgi:hypothetical protein
MLEKGMPGKGNGEDRGFYVWSNAKPLSPNAEIKSIVQVLFYILLSKKLSGPLSMLHGYRQLLNIR